jgi:acylphosphatase
MLQGAPAQLTALRNWMRDSIRAAFVADLTVTQVPPPLPRLDRFDSFQPGS